MMLNFHIIFVSLPCLLKHNLARFLWKKVVRDNSFSIVKYHAKIPSNATMKFRQMPRPRWKMSLMNIS